MENVYCLNHTVIPNFSGFHEEELILNPEPSLHSLSYPALRRGVTQLLGPWGEETEDGIMHNKVPYFTINISRLILFTKCVIMKLT